MIALALDPEVVASAWEQQTGCGSIFSPETSDADFTVPNVVGFDLFEMACMRQPPQRQLPQTADCDGGAATAAAAMLSAELLLQWDAVVPVPLLPASGGAWETDLPGSTCAAAHNLQRVPDTFMRSPSSSLSSSDKVCSPTPAAVLPHSKRAKLQQQQQFSVSAELAEDAQCAVVPDAPAAASALVPSSSCWSSDSSSGLAADGQESAAAFVAEDASVMPAAVTFSLQHPPAIAAHPASRTPSSSATGIAATAAATSTITTKPSWPASSSLQQHHEAPPHEGKAAAQRGNRARATHTAAAAAAAATAGAGTAEPFLRTRAEALARYREKRAHCTHAKKIRYHLRKVNADKRPRIKGRFVKKGELAETEVDPAAAAAADVTSHNDTIWDEASAFAGGVMGCWERQDGFLQAMQLPGMGVDLAAVHCDDAAAAAGAWVPAQAVAAADGVVINMEMFRPASLPDSRASATETVAGSCPSDAAAAAQAEAGAAAAMEMHLLGHLELGFGGLEDEAAAPLLGDDFFSDAHDMTEMHDITESSGASHACLLLS